MIPAILPDDEYELPVVQGCDDSSDPLHDQRFDNIAFLAAAICNAPYSRITMTYRDKLSITSHSGDHFCDTSSIFTFCEYTLRAEQAVLVVEDARCDERFAYEPLVSAEQGVVFYAGVSISSPDGDRVGTLCVVDTEAREFSDNDQAVLLKLAEQVETLLSVHSLSNTLTASQHILPDSQQHQEQPHAQLDEAAAVMIHDLKASMTKVARVAELLTEDYSAALDEDGLNWLSVLNNAALLAGKQFDDMLAIRRRDSKS